MFSVLGAEARRLMLPGPVVAAAHCKTHQKLEIFGNFVASRSAGPFVGRHFLLERHFAGEMISVGKARRCPFKPENRRKEKEKGGGFLHRKKQMIGDWSPRAQESITESMTLVDSWTCVKTKMKIIPIPLPQHQHTFCQRRRFDQDCPGLRQVEMNKMKSAWPTCTLSS